jgi:hypothetical protein
VSERPDSGIADARIKAVLDGRIARDEEPVPTGARLEVLAPLSGG